jgi:hypothetical protein
MAEARVTGHCLCGDVTFEVRGPIRDVLLCHCEECRRANGYVGAYTSAFTDDLVVLADDSLRWIDSPRSDRSARRGFCIECGSSLFWRAAGAERTSIAAGTIDRPTGLRIAAHIYTHQAGDYDELPDDGLPRDPEADSIEIRWS